MTLLDRLLARKPPPAAPLRGAPAVRRQKTYSAQTGFVYQYFYEGYRSSHRGNRAGHDHVFQVTRDRENFFPLTVFLSDAVVESWQQAHGRALTPTEQYAAVKMSLFEAFDERSDLGPVNATVEIDVAKMESYMATLEID